MPQVSFLLLFNTLFRMVRAYQRTELLAPNTNPPPEQWRCLLIISDHVDQISVVKGS